MSDNPNEGNPVKGDLVGKLTGDPLQAPAVSESERIDNEIESFADMFARLRHRVMIRRSDSAMYRDTRLLEWMAADARQCAAEGLEEGIWTEDEIAGFARSLQASVAAYKCKLRRVAGSPEFYVPDFPGVAATVLEDARRVGAAPCLDLTVAAGIGRELWDEECGNWVLVPSDLPRGNYVALKVAGESMQPLLHPGDVMLVRLDPAASRDDVVVARTGDDEFIVKRVGRMTAASIELRSVNPEFPSIRVARANQPVVGTVVLCWCEHTLTFTRFQK
jgi:hypothetical protein